MAGQEERTHTQGLVLNHNPNPIPSSNPNPNVAATVNAMTKDYSALMKAIDKKKGK